MCGAVYLFNFFILISIGNSPQASSSSYRRFTRQANPRLQESHHGDIPAGDQNLPAGIKSVHGLFARGCTHLRAPLQL